jgi:LmbE family N-acetylglucosaminyl deacetylase
MAKVALAIAAHPDDIEFVMAGTLLVLKEAGYDIHYMNLSTGNCGSTVYDSEQTAAIRLGEARAAAGLLGIF